MRRRALPGLLAAALLLPATPAHAAEPPSKATWLADVDTVMQGSWAYVDERVAQAGDGARLAINLDIDNTSLATYYDRGAPVKRVLRFTEHARAQGVTLVFSSGRKAGAGRAAYARRMLEGAGYTVGGVCLRRAGEGLVHGKVRCRQQWVDRGYTLVANVGNLDTDFAGRRNYERAFDLPDYDGALG
jgi:hypothetical protein